MSSSTLYFLANSITCSGTKIGNRMNFLFGFSNCAHFYMFTVHPINVYGTLFHNFFSNRSKLGAIFPSNLSQNGISFKSLHIVRNDLMSTRVFLTPVSVTQLGKHAWTSIQQ